MTYLGFFIFLIGFAIGLYLNFTNIDLNSKQMLVTYPISIIISICLMLFGIFLIWLDENS